MMLKIVYATTGLFLIAVLIMSASPQPVRADGGGSDEERTIRLSATAMAGPIGTVAPNSLGRDRVAIDGRITQGEQSIWGGELLQAPAGKSVSVTFDSIGKVTLSAGAVARFAASTTTHGESGQRVLIASLIDGDIILKLDHDAGAYVEAGGSAFSASSGASFRIGVSEGQPVLDTVSGTVTEQQPATQRRYVLRPIGSGATISVRTRSTRQLQIQVTDENDRRVPDLPILFLLAGAGGQSGGTLGAGAAAATSATVTTNAQGIATISYTAPAATGQESITATVQGTRYSHTWQVSIAPAAVGFWSLRNSLIVAGIAGGATTAIVVSTRDQEEEIRPLPPPQVRP